MKAFTLCVLLAFFGASLSAQAGEFFNIQTQLGKKIGEAHLPAESFRFVFIQENNADQITGRVGNINLPSYLEYGSVMPFGEELSKIILSSQNYEAFRKYILALYLTDQSVVNAPTYLRMKTTLRSEAQLVAAQKVFGSPSAAKIKVEIFEGLQDSFFYSASLVDGRDVYDAKSCQLVTNSPLWTVRFSNSQGDSIDAYYMPLFTTITRDPNGAGTSLFPNAKRMEIVGQQQCLSALKKFRALPQRVN